MADGQESLAHALVQLGLLTTEQLDKVRRAQARSGLRLGAQIVDSGLLTEDRLVSELAKHLGMDTIDPSRTPIHEGVKKLVPAKLAYRYRVVPIARRKEAEEELLLVAMSDPFDGEAARALDALVPGVSVRCLLAGESEIALALEQSYERPPEAEEDATLLPWVGPDDMVSDAGPIPMSPGAPIDEPMEQLSEAVPTVYKRREDRPLARSMPPLGADEQHTEDAMGARPDPLSEVVLAWRRASPKAKVVVVAAGALLLVFSVVIFLPDGEPDEDAAGAEAAPPPATPVVEPGFLPDAPEDLLLLGKKLEIYPGVFDERAAEGTGYVSVNGAALRATADERSNALMWLPIGQLVTRVSDVDGAALVMVPPQGPTGFVDPGVLGERKPIELLGREIGFKGCAVTKARSIDQCLYTGKDQQDGCLVVCRRFPGTRCELACRAAFDQCLESCRDSERRAQDPRQGRKRKRR